MYQLQMVAIGGRGGRSSLFSNSFQNQFSGPGPALGVQDAELTYGMSQVPAGAAPAPTPVRAPAAPAPAGTSPLTYVAMGAGVLVVLAIAGVI